MSERTKDQMDDHLDESEEMRESMDGGTSKPMGGDMEKTMETHKRTARHADDSMGEDKRKPMGDDMGDSMQMPLSVPPARRV